MWYGLHTILHILGEYVFYLATLEDFEWCNSPKRTIIVHMYTQ